MISQGKVSCFKVGKKMIKLNLKYLEKTGVKYAPVCGGTIKNGKFKRR